MSGLQTRKEMTYEQAIDYLKPFKEDELIELACYILKRNKMEPTRENIELAIIQCAEHILEMQIWLN